MNTNTSSAAATMSLTVFHADHGVREDLIRKTIEPLEEGFFCLTVDLDAAASPLLSGLYGPLAGDSPVTEGEVEYVRRSEDRPLSRMIRLPKRETRRLTVIGVKDNENAATIFTAYGGECAPREPGDPSLSDEERKESEVFWAQHALAF